MQSFEEYLSAVVTSAAIPSRPLVQGECQSEKHLRCRLCHAVNIDYPTEAKLKNEALQKFWKTLRIPLHLDPLVLSPLGRNYRTTTKRRVFPWRDSVKLGLLSPDEKGDLKPFNVVDCAIEPVAHAAVYRQIQESIVKPYAKSFAKSLSYVIIKGNYTENTVIFNVRDLSPEVVRAANTLSKSLTKKYQHIVGLFLYEDDTSPQYYLGSKGQGTKPKFKKLFGKPEIFHRTMGRSFLYSPLSFSQVNQSIMEKMISAAESTLAPTKESKLFDLYCGYGLFALCLSDKVQFVTGAEVSSSSIESANANAKRQKVSNARFIRTDINEETAERILAQASPNDVVLVDPPRKGTAEGVIEAIAAKLPRKVVHIFCDIDIIGKELRRWSKSGYTAKRAMPFDMFPGTPSVETMILLEPDSR